VRLPFFRRDGTSIVEVGIARALKGEGCPICRLVREGEEGFLWTMLYESSGDLRAHGEFCSSLGLCSRHASLLEKMVRERNLITPSGVARFYQSLSAYVRERIWKGIPEGRCRLCTYAHAAATRYAGALARYLEAEINRDLYERSDGLCLPHLRATLAAARPRVREFLRGDFVRRLNELEKALQELQRKQSYDVPETPTPEESAAWTEALWRFGGMEFEELITKEP